MAGQPHRRDNVFRDNIRLVANNHRVQRHVVESVANQWRQTFSGTSMIEMDIIYQPDPHWVPDSTTLDVEIVFFCLASTGKNVGN